MNVKKTKKFKENHPENYHVHDIGETVERIMDSLILFRSLRVEELVERTPDSI